MRILHIIATVIAITFFSQATNAQISDSLYSALPDSLKPRIKNSVTSDEKQRLLLFLPGNVADRYRNELGGFVALLLQDTLARPSLKVDYLKVVAGYYNGYRSDSAVFFNEKLIAAIGSNSRYKADLASVYVSLGTSFIYLDKYDSAINALNSSVPFANFSDTNFVEVYYNACAFLYDNLRIYNKAIFYSQKVTQYWPANDRNSDGYIQQLIDNSVIYSQLFKQTNSKIYSDSAYSILHSFIAANQAAGKYWFNACYYLVGLLDYYHGNYTHAIKMFDSSALPIYNQHSKFYANNYYGKYLYKAASLVKLHKYAAGRAILDTLEIPQANYTSKQQKYEALCELAENTGHYKEALAYHRQFVLYSDSLDFEGQKGRVFEAEQKYSVKEKEAEIAILENKSLQEAARQNKITAAGAVAVLVFILIALVWYIRYKRLQVQRRGERQKLADELLAMEQEAQLRSVKLQAAFEAAIDTQRKTISQNMHDEVASRVALLPMVIADAKNSSNEPAVKKILGSIEAEAKSVYNDVREFMHTLNASQLAQNYDVVELLDNLDLRFGIGRGLEVTYEADTEQLQALFTKQQHAEMYMLIKEAVTNTLKHSSAQKMHISIYLKDGFFHFHIRDYGRSVQQGSGDGTGMGLAGMQQRMQLLKGRVTFFAGTEGFVISGSFPAEAQMHPTLFTPALG